ncbi:MAG: PqiC family protein [Thiotrichales bacterium]|nr:PqiC family protein [Thiotrichales bacterium]
MRILIIPVLLFLISCGAQKPVPIDHFYRLPEISSESVPDVSLSDGVIYVSIFETDGLHRERALVYSEGGNELELKQYHYQHWVDSPTRMLRDHLVQYLRAASASPTVVTSVDPYPQMEIRGKIHRFDQINTDSNTSVTVSLELRADSDNRLLHIQDYDFTETVSGDSVEDTVNSYNSLLIKSFTQFVNDVKASQ